MTVLLRNNILHKLAMYIVFGLSNRRKAEIIQGGVAMDNKLFADSLFVSYIKGIPSNERI